ncbi:MAG: hypothetical protein J6X55_04755 [Victivallales bacterium]|nr:hypothetical protein [Victivallales bacterium]
MIRWKSKCTYHAGRYPLVALLDLFFILLLLFVLSSSMLYLPGVLFATNAGLVDEEGEPISTFGLKEDFSQYVIADKMVLTVANDNGIKLQLNMKPVTMDELENELEMEATKLKKIYSNANGGNQQERKGFRPKLVLSAAPSVPVETIDAILKKIRDRKMDVVFKAMSPTE